MKARLFASAKAIAVSVLTARLCRRSLYKSGTAGMNDGKVNTCRSVTLIRMHVALTGVDGQEWTYLVAHQHDHDICFCVVPKLL
jgi:hypothetical protein